MNLLLEATLRGSLVFALVWGIDRWSGARMRAAWRRGWWWLVPVAFVLPVHIPLRVHVPVPVALVRESQLDMGGSHLAVNPWQENGKAPIAGIPAKPTRPVLSLLPTVWLAGVLVYGLLLIGRTRSVSRRWTQALPSTEPELLQLLEACRQELGVTTAVGLLVSPQVRNPAVLGCFRPRLLLPESLASSLPRAQLRAIFLHELAHIRANDVRINWLFSAVAALHWFNPLAHLALASWRQFAEEAADETAIAGSHDPSGQAYGEVLLHALALREGEPIPFGALSLGEPIHNLKRRFQMIHHYAHKTSRSVLFCLVAAVLLAVISLRPLRAQDAAPGDDVKTVTASANQWLAQWDARDLTACWNQFAPATQARDPLAAFQARSGQAHDGLGKVLQRKLLSVSVVRGADRQPAVASDQAIATYEVDFSNQGGMVETLSYTKSPDGTWHPDRHLILAL